MLGWVFTKENNTSLVSNQYITTAVIWGCGKELNLSTGIHPGADVIPQPTTRRINVYKYHRSGLRKKYSSGNLGINYITDMYTNKYWIPLQGPLFPICKHTLSSIM